MRFTPRLACSFVCGIAALVFSFMTASASTIEDLQPGQTYRVGQVSISGNKAVSNAELLAQMKTKERPFYLVWKKRPVFEPEVFTADLKRLRRFYQARGYYSAVVNYELTVKDHLIYALVRITENKPVTVQWIRVQVDDHDVPQGHFPYDRLRLKPSDIFAEDAYQQGEQVLRNSYRDAGYAHVKVTRKAHVNVAANQARVWYLLHRGVPAVFGTTEVIGEKDVEPNIILRELTYKPGERFSQSKIDESRDRILKLGLFALVRFDPQLETGNPQIVPIKLVVREKPKHQISVGGGYNTEQQFVLDAQWTDRNFAGNGRQFSAFLGYSNINSAADVTLRQPYLLDLRAFTGILELREDIEQVPPFTLFAARFLPHVEYAFSSELTGNLGYQLEYAKLTSVDPTVVRALNIRQSGIVSGPYAALTLNTTDNPYNPTRGYSVLVDAVEGGGGFGGNFDFYRIFTEIKHYESVGWGTILATRLKVGTGDSLGSKNEYPLFYRFYAGGEASVRGYGYWRLGPKSAANVPLGGLSDIEGSVELRHQIWEKLGGAIFIDFGQLSLHPYDLPVSNLEFAAGPALSYMTPVGPIRIDVGIPFKKPRGDQQWQVYFSIGQFF